MSATPDPRPVIVVGFDGSNAAHAALARAIDRVGATGKLYLVHSWTTPASAWNTSETSGGHGYYQSQVSDVRADAETVLEAAKRMHPALAQVDWEPKLIGGPAPIAIADVASERQADEIILGTRGFGRLRALLGSVAHEVIHLAACPVTVIPERMVANVPETDSAPGAAAAR